MPAKSNIKELMNTWSGRGVPFLFIIDFEQQKPLIFRLNEIDPAKILFEVNGFTNNPGYKATHKKFRLVKHPEKYEEYLLKFNRVQDEISYGNSYLLNLTCATPIELNLTLRDVFLRSNARYKLWVDEEFVCFSPEIFVTIHDGIIRSFPMKGTIDASINGAENLILNDPKESAEHYTIVDLIRNDLNAVSNHVRVERFRYIETIATHDKSLLQLSSEICGELNNNYLRHIGDILFSMLPAGSVSGAPKKKTTEIIREVEKCDRGYYTGIFGIFDGNKLDIGVMIRFIEKRNNNYIFRSGGGITSLSSPETEYREMIDKIYVPFV